MTQPYGHVDAPTLMGSWPIIPSFTGGAASVRPRTLLSRAAILGARREDSVGFDVAGKGFLLFIDGVQYNIGFTGSGNLTLDEVVSQINAIIAPDPEVAFRDNGFLRLESSTIGENSSLRLETDANPEIFLELGLFAGVESRAGDISPSFSIDPDRQVAYHGQLSMMEGEDLEARVINRFLMQVAINSDLQHGILTKKRVAKVDKASVVDPNDGFVLPGTIYTGPDALPTEAQLEGIVSVLDSFGNEVYAPVETVLNSVSGGVTTYIDTQEMTFGSGVTPIFSATDPENEVYVRCDDAAMGTLQNVPLKVLEYLSPTEVVVRNIDSDGNIVSANVGVGTIERLSITKEHIKVTGLWTNSGMTQRVEQYQYPKLSGLTIDRVEHNNRIVCDAGGFSGVAEVGDLVVIAGHDGSYPYNNDGEYRVSKIIDDQTLELLSDDYGPVFLNPTAVSTLGTVDVTTDGNFWTNPYVSLNAEVTSGTYTIVHKKQSTMEEFIDDPGSMSGSLLEHAQEVDSTVLTSLKNIIGPSAELDEYLYGDPRLNLESIYQQYDREHHGYDSGSFLGRHSDIRPDTIDMWPGVAGTTFKVRADVGEGSGDIKLLLLDSVGDSHWNVRADGRMYSYESGGGSPSWVGIYPFGGMDIWKDGGVDGSAYIELTGAETNGRATIRLEGNHQFTTPDLLGGDGSASIRFIGDRDDPNPPEFSLNLRPRAGVGPDSDASLLKIDVVDDGYGGSHNASLAITGRGEVGIGTYDPYELLRVGSHFHYHEGGDKAFAWNAYYDGTWRLLNSGYSVLQYWNPTTGLWRMRYGNSTGSPGDAQSYNDRIVYDPLNDCLSLGANYISSGYRVTLTGDVIVGSGDFRMYDGDIIMGYQDFIRGPANNTWFNISGGTGYSDGACISLYGSSYSSTAGAIISSRITTFTALGQTPLLGSFRDPAAMADLDYGGAYLYATDWLKVGSGPAYAHAYTDVSAPALDLSGGVDGRYLVGIQDGTGRVNKYWNAYYKSTATTGHYCFKGGEDALREVWSGGEIAWSWGDGGVHANDGDPITWVEYMRLHDNGTLEIMNTCQADTFYCEPANITIGIDFLTSARTIGTNVYSDHAMVLQAPIDTGTSFRLSAIRVDFQDFTTQYTAAKACTLDIAGNVGTSYVYPAWWARNLVATGQDYVFGSVNDVYNRNAYNSVIALGRCTSSGVLRTDGAWNIEGVSTSGGTGVKEFDVIYPVQTYCPVFATNNLSSVSGVYAAAYIYGTGVRVRTYDSAGALSDHECSFVCFGFTSTLPDLP
jgi:hypothetical protein